jgi:predicted nucleotidyltransferase component of viral defense system
MITEGYLARHSGGGRGGADPALLDVAQDYALRHLYDEGAFDLGVVLKGGTSLRKFRAGNAGRFSTDLDFAAPDATTGELVLDMIDGATLWGLEFHLVDRDTLRARLEITTPLGKPRLPAKVEVSARPLWLATERRAPVALPVHKGYEFKLPDLPVPALEEALAEKLAAWRRRRKIRDLYDLYLLGQGPLDEALTRRLFVLKVWHDVVQDGLGRGPLAPVEAVSSVDVARMPSEDIGLLTQPVEPDRWVAFVTERYAFLAHLDSDEQRAARCSPADGHFVSELVRRL